MKLIKLILLPLWYLSYLFPRRKDLWIFGCNLGKTYGDNSRYFFEYVNANHPEVEAVWITASETILEQLTTAGYRACLKDSWKGRWTCLRAGKGFTTHGKHDLGNEFTNGICLYNLWHGMPIKMIGHIPPKNLLKRIYYRLWYPQRWNHFFITSEKFRDIMSAYHINSYKPIQRISRLGMARFDGYVKAGSEEIIREYKSKFGEDLRVILYCPTYREQNEFAAYAEHGPIDIFKNYGFDTAKMQNLMEEMNAVFLVKMHPMANDTMDTDKAQDRIRLVAGNEIDDLYYLMKDVDVLLSDYSSLLMDYMILDRPVIHTIFDFELYKRIRTFNFDYEEIVGGVKVTNWDETLEAIKTNLSSDPYRDLRRKVCSEVNDFPFEGSNCETLYRFCTNS